MYEAPAFSGFFLHVKTQQPNSGLQVLHKGFKQFPFFWVAIYNLSFQKNPQWTLQRPLAFFFIDCIIECSIKSHFFRQWRSFLKIVIWRRSDWVDKIRQPYVPMWVSFAALKQTAQVILVRAEIIIAGSAPPEPAGFPHHCHIINHPWELPLNCETFERWPCHCGNPVQLCNLLGVHWQRERRGTCTYAHNTKETIGKETQRTTIAKINNND